MYLMDEPTTGLHPADVDLLVTELQRLVDSGNTVVVVEHDMRVVAQADRLIEMGPGAGARGGRVVADGSPAAVAETDTATGRVLAEHCYVHRVFGHGVRCLLGQGVHGVLGHF